MAIFCFLEQLAGGLNVGGSSLKGLGNNMAKFVEKKHGLRYVLKQIYQHEKRMGTSNTSYSLFTPLLIVTEAARVVVETKKVAHGML